MLLLTGLSHLEMIFIHTCTQKVKLSFIDKMVANFEIFSRIQPHEYLKKFLNEKVRPDGRVLEQFRKTMITKNAISTANASAMVRLGGTTVVCGIKAEVSEPKMNAPGHGYLGT